MEDFPARVLRLQQALGLTQAKLISKATDYNVQGLSTDTIRNAVTGRRGGKPSALAIEAIARALEQPPESFPHYRLAVARQRLDPDIAGLERAVENADLLLKLTSERPADVAARVALLREVNNPEDGGAPPSRKGKGPAR